MGVARRRGSVAYSRSTAPLRALGQNASTLLGAVAGCGLSIALVKWVGERGDFDHTAGQLALAVVAVGLVTACSALELGRAASVEVVMALDEEQELLTEEKKSPPPSVTRRGLWAGVELSAIMLLVYAVDRTDMVPRGAKRQDPVAFWRLWALLTVLALCTVRITKVSSSILPREQTEEWKGWMQLMFLLYHYFAEAELYNAIRVYIAAYVWMTGYGNYLYYSKTRDFSLVRVAQTLFRLNFFALITCLLLRNEYMLYYICPMHTFFTLFVYGVLRVKSAIWAKEQGWHGPVAVGVTLALTSLLYDSEAVFRVAFRPLESLLSFHDPLHPDSAAMHEWTFRSGLDRYIWVGGMAAAAFLPVAASFFERLAKMDSAAQKTLCYSAVLVATLAVGYGWYARYFTLDKYAYNAKHPFTSFIPISLYIVLRNLHPALRSRYLEFFTHLGRVTLETYILQFHVWMKTTGLNGSPKFLVRLLPEGYFWSNFALVSAVYLVLSFRVFRATVTLREVLVPSDPRDLLRSAAAIAALGLIAAGAGYSIRVALPVALTSATSR